MKHGRWRQVEELFHAALERAPEERQAFLGQACGVDTELRLQVEHLISIDQCAASRLERPVTEEVFATLYPDPPLEGAQVGPYRILSPLGAGGMGKVYRARDTKLGRDVAIKTLPATFVRDPERLARFRREARTLASLNHPNIAAIYGIEESGDEDCLVLELVEGETLCGPLPIERALDYARQVADALQAAHEKGFIHRDLKPANVKVTPQGRVKVLDFGLAKAIWGRESNPDLSQTLAGQIVGTPSYMSPEQVRGKEVDNRTDIWAFGCLLYELLTGKRGFEGETVSDTLAAVLEHEPDWQVLPAKTPEKVLNLLRQCLQKDATRRLNNIADARTTIEEVQRGPNRWAVQTRQPRRWWLLSATAVVSLVAIVLAATMVVLRQPIAKPIESLAVLPLENLSHDPEQEYFADGMTDDLITELAKISALRVISRRSVMHYKGTKKSIPEIARELNVDAVLEGTVTREQGRVRITAQLIAASPEKHVWAEKYEESLSEILKLQDAIAKDVASEIQIKVTQRERALLATARVIDPAAYEAYMKGRYLWERSGEENLRKSREYFEQATQKDPTYALAWAGLAGTYERLAGWGVLSNQGAMPRARAAAEKALELDNSLVQPLVTLAVVKINYEWDWAGAERLCRRAIESNPNYGDAHHVYATYLAEVGRLGEAVAEARRAREVEPLSGVYGANVVWKLYLARQYGEAELEFRKLTTFYPNETGSYILASVYLQTGRQREAVAELQRTATKSNRAVLQLMYLGHALGVSGARAAGQKVLEEMQSLSQRRYVPPEYIAIVCEGLGERERALQWFEKAYSERSMNGWILPDPQLDQIRTEPRFKNLMRQMGLPQ